MNRKQHIVITGATGFVGKAVLTHLSNDYQITTVNLRAVSPKELDLSGVTTIIHCAALVHQMQGAPREEYFRINTQLTMELAETAKRQHVEQFIFLSTSHVYGEYGDCFNRNKLFTESDTCRPIDPYGESKFAAENAILSLAASDFVVSVVRAPMVYGEGAKGNLNTLRKLVKSVPVLPFAEDRNRRSLIYVGNLAHFIKRTLETRAGGLLLAQDEAPLSIQQIVLLLGESLGVRPLLFRLPNFVFNFFYWIMPDVMKRLFGSLALDSTHSNLKIDYKAQVSTKEGFRRMTAASAESLQP